MNHQTPDFSKELSIYSTIYILGSLIIMDRSNITSAVQSKPRVLNENFENAAFTSELCQFLTNLAKTPGDEYSDLALDLSRLREALLNEVETESNSISDTRGNTSESEGCSDSASFSDPSSMSASEASGSSPLSSSRSRSRIDSDSSGSSSPQSDQSSASAQSYTRDLNHSNRNQYLNYYTGVWNRRGRVHFSLESGARYELGERDIHKAYSQYGKITGVYLFPRARRGLDGHVDYVEPVDAKKAVHRVVDVGQCRLYTLPQWDNLSDIPVPHQILLESRYLPNVWEKEMVLRSFFSKFGLVDGVVFLGYTDGKAGLQRFVISFRDSKPAQDLIGSSLKILSSTVFVKEVTRNTIRSSSGTGTCPW